MNLVNQLLIDLGDVTKYKKIRPFDLKMLGYYFSKRRIKVQYRFWLHEILNDGSHKPASFCFLLDHKKNLGIVIPREFVTYYKLGLEENAVAKKRKSPSFRPGLE